MDEGWPERGWVGPVVHEMWLSLLSGYVHIWIWLTTTRYNKTIAFVWTDGLRVIMTA